MVQESLSTQALPLASTAQVGAKKLEAERRGVRAREEELGAELRGVRAREGEPEADPRGVRAREEEPKRTLEARPRCIFWTHSATTFFLCCVDVCALACTCSLTFFRFRVRCNSPPRFCAPWVPRLNRRHQRPPGSPSQASRKHVAPGSRIFADRPGERVELTSLETPLVLGVTVARTTTPVRPRSRHANDNS